MMRREFPIPIWPFLSTPSPPGLVLPSSFCPLAIWIIILIPHPYRPPSFITLFSTRKESQRRKFWCLALFSIALLNFQMLSFRIQKCGPICNTLKIMWWHSHPSSHYRSTFSHSELSHFPSQTISSFFIALHQQGWNIILLFCLKSFTSFLSQKNVQIP